MKDTEKISLIIPVYIVNEQLLEMTDACLTSFFYNTSPGVELIVVDDGSPKPYSTDIGKLIRLDDNGGYSKAANAGLEAATGDILVLGNNDLIFHENWLTGLLFPLQLGFDVATCWTTDQHYVLSDKIERDAKFGSIFAMNRNIYDLIGGFDEQFRGIFADTDLRRRMIKEGVSIGKNLSMVIEHLARATYKELDISDDSEFLRGQRLYEAKWGYAE